MEINQIQTESCTSSFIWLRKNIVFKKLTIMAKIIKKVPLAIFFKNRHEINMVYANFVTKTLQLETIEQALFAHFCPIFLVLIWFC